MTHIFKKYFWQQSASLISVSFHSTSSLTWSIPTEFCSGHSVFPWNTTQDHQEQQKDKRDSRPWLLWKGSSSAGCSFAYSAHAQHMHGKAPAWPSPGKKEVVLPVLQKEKGKADPYLVLSLKKYYLVLAHQYSEILVFGSARGLCLTERLKNCERKLRPGKR